VSGDRFAAPVRRTRGISDGAGKRTRRAVDQAGTVDAKRKGPGAAYPMIGQPVVISSLCFDTEIILTYPAAPDRGSPQTFLSALAATMKRRLRGGIPASITGMCVFILALETPPNLRKGKKLTIGVEGHFFQPMGLFFSGSTKEDRQPRFPGFLGNSSGGVNHAQKNDEGRRKGIYTH